ncbi:hypothetical protein DFH94DRAFT_114831 [Russula ochroleuca]|uniref:RING-type domain-containing protein n=1 Tax=Russula ochroleuca TaxID=152965 RepID=A0A9P5K110_9AGAM|nr:hypothetical protein DFH94DRAFT_114831 [Russula ochroleuca]
MCDLDCPICLNSFTFELIRSLPCGHTYCSSCVDKLIDDAPTCPECRYEFEFDEVRRLFIKPSASNNSSGSQAASRSDDQDGFIKQAKHIARRLQKLNATSSAQSVKTAADVIEHVAIIQCKEAQEIIWNAVREFWLRLVVDFEQMDQCRNEKSSLQRRIAVLEEFRGRCSGLQLEVEQQRSQAQVYADRLEDKSREIERLTEALRNVDDDVKQERERKDVLIARLRASEVKHRAQVKQLKVELKSRDEASSRRQLEEESLIIEPGEAYNEARSHRLDVYNEGPPNSKRRKLSPELSIPADGSDNLSSPGDLSDHWPKIVTSPPELQIQPRERTGPTHQSAQPDSGLVQPSPQRPKFGSDWNFSQQRPCRKSTGNSDLPYPLDAQGRPQGLLKLGSRVRMKAAG